jgi:hypothetical protein
MSARTGPVRVMQGDTCSAATIATTSGKYHCVEVRELTCLRDRICVIEILARTGTVGRVTEAGPAWQVLLLADIGIGECEAVGDSGISTPSDFPLLLSWEAEPDCLPLLARPLLLIICLYARCQ